jgi:hypothetical protein
VSKDEAIYTLTVVVTLIFALHAANHDQTKRGLSARGGAAWRLFGQGEHTRLGANEIDNP